MAKAVQRSLGYTSMDAGGQANGDGHSINSTDFDARYEQETGKPSHSDVTNRLAEAGQTIKDLGTKGVSAMNLVGQRKRQPLLPATDIEGIELKDADGVAGPQPAIPRDEFRQSGGSEHQPVYNLSLNGSSGDLSHGASKAGLSRMSSTRGSVITFRNIRYVVPVKRYPWSRSVKKNVLDGVSGVMDPGLNAIMGPTGSGKSSLLDVLAGRKNPRFLRGDVLVDGAEQPDNFKCDSGYVVQDDIVMGTLTVRENLSFSAALRLPWPDKDRKKKVNEVIEELGLSKVADAKIGTELIRGVSGGERKRTNIGMELITDPRVLFLDEPTTGLDAFTAGSVIHVLRTLASSGRTIILSIHQPKYSIYKLFDTLTLLVSGSVIYHGTGGMEPLKYFKRLGYNCEKHNSPPDFFMDIVHGEIIRRTPSSNDLLEAGHRDSIVGDTEEEKLKAQEIGKHLIEKWEESQEQANVNEQVKTHCEGAHRGAGATSFKKGAEVPFRTSLGNQIIWVSWRTALNLFRNPESSVIQLVVYLFFGISIGTVFYNLNLSVESGIPNRQGLFFFLILQMVFVNLGAVEVFIKERVIFVHESSSGFYRVSVYFLSKIFCDMLPIKTLPVILFMPIVYFMAKLKLEFGAFLFYELNLVLATCAACGVAFFISASVSIFGIANIFISIIYVFMMVFGNFLITVPSMIGGLQWCKYLSVFNYAYSGLSVNEFRDLVFCPMYNTTSNFTRTCMAGTTVLEDKSIPYTTAWDMWCNELGMLLITLFFLALCYIQLRRIEKYK